MEANHCFTQPKSVSHFFDMTITHKWGSKSTEIHKIETYFLMLKLFLVYDTLFENYSKSHIIWKSSNIYLLRNHWFHVTSRQTASQLSGDLKVTFEFFAFSNNFCAILAFLMTFHPPSAKVARFDCNE